MGQQSTLLETVGDLELTFSRCMHVSSFVALALVILGKLTLTDNSTNVHAAADDEKAIYMSRFCQTGEIKSETVTNRVKANARCFEPTLLDQVPDARYKVERDKTFGVREYFRGVFYVVKTTWIFHGPMDILSEIWLQSPKCLRGGGTSV